MQGHREEPLEVVIDPAALELDREATAGLAGVTVEVREAERGPPVGKPIQIRFTILGLLPLASHFSIDFINRSIVYGGLLSSFWVPLAQAIVSGLTFATLSRYWQPPRCWPCPTAQASATWRHWPTAPNSICTRLGPAGDGAGHVSVPRRLWQHPRK
ncbi:MAG: hypothetical protein OXL38_02860 [Gammaproteobacteria bacterium]|nr:hypothetical protein [Gammaproteobacteria bacterium]